MMTNTRITIVALSSFLAFFHVVKLGTKMDVGNSIAVTTMSTDAPTTNTTTVPRITLQVPSLEHYLPSFQPLWSCLDKTPDPLRKLVFVHVFKTAGSTFRTFFERYGAKCRKGVTVLIGCSDITSNYQTGELWSNGKRDDSCTIKSSWNRLNHTVTARRTHQMTNAFLPQHETDILIGHMPMGIHTGWREDQQSIQPTYVTFVRDPVAKYVSSRLFVYQSRGITHLTQDDAVERIRKDIWERKGRQYNVYTKYLLTPEQKEMNMSIEEQAETIMRNLVEFPTVVGVVERMADSLALLKHIIDPTDQVTTMIDAMDGTRTSSVSSQKVLVKNKSTLSTSRIVAELQKDTTTYQRLLDCLQMEKLIYDFTLQLQDRQLQWLRAQR